MNNLDFHITNLISSFLQNKDKINYFRLDKFMYQYFFTPQRSLLRRHTISHNNLCISCEKYCGCEGHLVYLCNCIDIYPVQHLECGDIHIFRRYTKIDKCPICSNKTMIFRKTPKDINML